MEFPRYLRPDESTRAGRMLAAGDVRVTVTDCEADEHITVRVKGILDNREVNGQRPEPSENKNWIRVPLVRATHVFLEVPNAGGTFPDKIGTFYPRTGRFFADNQADPKRIDAAIMATYWLEGGYDGLEGAVGDGAAQYDFQEESYCGKCGRQLTDPVSIERGIGPECYGKDTGAQHQVKVKHVNEMTDEDWDEVQSNLPAQYTAQRIIKMISELPAVDQKKIRNELNMWHPPEGPTKLFEGR